MLLYLSCSPRMSKSVCFASTVQWIESITVHLKRRLSTGSYRSESVLKCNEDLGATVNRQKAVGNCVSLLDRYRQKRPLSVTDIFLSEWCQKQMEFRLVRGKPEATEAMKAGTDHHANLEKEVIKKGGVHVKKSKDFWAMKLLNFIFRANQLLNEGLTRELPLVGFVHGVWMVGSIDELQLFANGSVQNVRLVESKTRSRSSLPPEAQKRNGKLQLMCYKHIWDNIASNFPIRRFYDYFELSPHYILSEEVQDLADASGHPAKQLDDIVTYYRSRCAALPPSHNELLLRYIFQGDGSLLEEEKIIYDSKLFMSQLKRSLEFWSGEQPPSYVSEEDLWKCGCCSFSDVCSAQR